MVISRSKISGLAHHPAAEEPDNQITRSPDHQITRGILSLQKLCEIKGAHNNVKLEFATNVGMFGCILDLLLSGLLTKHGHKLSDWCLIKEHTVSYSLRFIIVYSSTNRVAFSGRSFFLSCEMEKEVMIEFQISNSRLQASNNPHIIPFGSSPLCCVWNSLHCN